MFQGSTDLEEDPIENAQVVMSRSHTQGQSEDTSPASGVEDNVQGISQKCTDPISHEVVSTITDPELNHVVNSFIDEFNYDDEFFLQDQVCKPKLIRFQKRQVQHAEWLQHKLLVWIYLFPSSRSCRRIILHWRNSEREVLKEVALSRMDYGIISGHLSHIVDIQ